MTMHYTDREERYLAEKQAGALYQPVYRMCSDGNYRDQDAAARYEQARIDTLYGYQAASEEDPA